MVERMIHFVGSIPGDDAEEAMRATLRRAGSRVRSITDGERSIWIVMPIIKALHNNPDVRLRHDGDWSSYDALPRFQVRRGHQLAAGDLEIGQVARFEENYPIFRRLRTQLGYEGLSFQVGLPGDLDLSLFSFGPAGALRYRRAFATALVHDIKQIFAAAGADVVFQIEIPAELVLVTKVPAPLRPAMAAFLARGVVRLAADAPDGTRFGVHLCLGDLGNKALGRLRNTRPLVQFANAIASRWPVGRELEFLHAPLAAGTDPAPLEPGFYAALAGLRLPPGTRFIAGLVHETRTLPELRRTLTMVEDSYGHPVDVAAACGLGRRTISQANANIDLARQLCDG